MRKSELIDIYILEILGHRASEMKRMTQKQLIHWLEVDYGISITRNTLSSYVRELREKKYVAGKRGLYRINQFNDNELRLLIDGVLFGQHIPTEDAKTLIEKLKGMSEIGLKNRVKNVYYLEGFNHTQNRNLYEMIDTIDVAIQTSKQIRVEQCRYDKDIKLSKTGKSFVVDPYQLVATQSRYYLICYVEEKNSKIHGNELENLRLDRLGEVEILATPRRPIEKVPGFENGKRFQLDQYMKEHIYMWSGESKRVTLRIKTYYIGDFIDWFGTDFHVLKKDEKYMEVSLKVNVQALIKWALQYGQIATVLAPEDVRDKIRMELQQISSNYLD